MNTSCYREENEELKEICAFSTTGKAARCESPSKEEPGICPRTRRPVRGSVGLAPGSVGKGTRGAPGLRKEETVLPSSEEASFCILEAHKRGGEENSIPKKKKRRGKQ